MERGRSGARPHFSLQVSAFRVNPFSVAAPQKPLSRRPPAHEPQPSVAPAPKPPPPSGPVEIGWLPDCVYTGEKFETNLAFFADSLGRITRFSREPADLAKARRLAGQAALPGLVNGHSLSWQRVLRGRGGAQGWDDLRAKTAARLREEEIFEAARMAFTEMMLSGITCVGEFHELRRLPDGSPTAEANATAKAIVRAAHEAGIRIALFDAPALAGDKPRSRIDAVDSYLRELEALRADIVTRYPADEAWLGVAPESFEALPPDAFKAIAAYSHAQRLRLQTRAAVALLASNDLVDKRLTLLGGSQLTDEDCQLLGAARAAVCVCPSHERAEGRRSAPVERLLAAGSAIAIGTAGNAQIDLLKDARQLDYELRVGSGKTFALGAKALFHAATVAGARSLGATGGALEVGRPADFFTVSLYDPSIAGADPASLLSSVVFGLERRAIREVWIGARQIISGGRHPNQGVIVGRFVELQRRIWAD